MNILKVDGKINVKVLIISILITLGTGYLSSLLTQSSTGIYASLRKPFFSPPAWVFPIVWTKLYIMMAVAAYRVWMRGKSGVFINRAIFFYILQLILNFLWPIIFFRLQLFGLAFLELMLLLVLILLTTFEFFKIDRLAGFLMIPYIIWVSFAGVLNFAIWLLNEA
jgi:translocator protein